MTIQTRLCPNCGTLSDPGASYCYNCGSALVRAASVAAPTAKGWTLIDIAKAIGIVVSGLIAVSIPAAVVALVLAGGDEIEEDPAALTVSIGASAFLELFLLGTAIHFSVRKYGLPVSALGLRWPTRGGFWMTLGLAIALVIGGLAVNLLYFAALASLGVEPETDIEEAYQSAGPLITLAVLSLIFAPAMEEVFYRGFVFGGLRPYWGVGLAAAGSGLLFGLSHLGNPGSIYLIPPVAAIGAIFALGYAYSGSLITSFVAHFMFNSIALAAGIAEYS